MSHESIGAARDHYVSTVLLNANYRREKLVGSHGPRDQGGGQHSDGDGRKKRPRRNAVRPMKPGIQARGNPGGDRTQKNDDADDRLIPTLACPDVGTLGKQLSLTPQQNHRRDAGGEVESQENPRVRPIQAPRRSEETHRRYDEAEDYRAKPPRYRNVHRLTQHNSNTFRTAMRFLAKDAVCGRASTAQVTSGGRTHPRRLLVELG